MTGDNESSKSLLTTGDTNNIEKPNYRNAPIRDVDKFILLRVVNFYISLEVRFKVDPNSVLDRLKSAYCSKLGFHENKWWFMFNDHRIADGETPNELGLVSGDIIDIYHNIDGDDV